MFQKTATRVLSVIFIAALILTSAFVVTTRPVHADGTMPKKIKTFYYPGGGSMNNLYIIGGKLQKKKSKIYNKKVLKFAKVKYDNFTEDVVRIKKAGKSKIKIKVKEAKKPYSTTVIAYKYTNAFATFKIGGKEYKDKYKKGYTYKNEAAGATLTGKVEIKPAKGWTLKKIIYYDYASESGSKTIKNGDEVNATNGEIVVEMKHKKSKMSWWGYYWVGEYGAG